MANNMFRQSSCRLRKTPTSKRCSMWHRLAFLALKAIIKLAAIFTVVKK